MIEWGLWVIQRERSLGLRPIFFVPGTLWRTWGTRPIFASAIAETLNCTKGSQVDGCGIPHLAKNERDMGHPRFCCWLSSRSLRILCGTSVLLLV
jgi:hypothetical protein